MHKKFVAKNYEKKTNNYGKAQFLVEKNQRFFNASEAAKLIFD